MILRSGDAEIYFTEQGKGAPVVLLHPFPAHHGFWLPVAEQLAPNFRLIIPDLRGLGTSQPGDGPATMEKHAEDIRRLCDQVGIGRAVFVGISIGGYILFEFWRQFRERVTALALCDTKAAPDTDEVRKTRLEAAAQVLESGTERFVDAQLARLLGETTRRNRPDLVERARRMMMIATAPGIAAVQQGMAARPDSTPTLASINVPTLFICGSEDILTGEAEHSVMQKHVPGSVLRVMPAVGHYSAFENPDEFAKLLRGFLGKVEHRG